MSKPRIGLAALSAVNGANNTLLSAVNRAYVDAVVAAGGLPFLLPIQDPADAVDAIAGVDGLLLCGGVDVDPAEYGAPAGPDISDVDGDRDGWELALAEAAGQARIPVLGVCRGEQVLNVSAGGTLVRDVPTSTGMNHRDIEDSHHVVHEIWFEPDSLLAELCESVSIGVNTLHHQAVDRLGVGFRSVAWAPDSTIEAIESITDWPAIGVQWHPELLVEHRDETVSRAHRSVFSWLVSAAGARRLHAVPARSEGATVTGLQPVLMDMDRRQAS